MSKGTNKIKMLPLKAYFIKCHVPFKTSAFTERDLVPLQTETITPNSDRFSALDGS